MPLAKVAHSEIQGTKVVWTLVPEATHYRLSLDRMQSKKKVGTLIENLKTDKTEFDLSDPRIKPAVESNQDFVLRIVASDGKEESEPHILEFSTSEPSKETPPPVIEQPKANKVPFGKKVAAFWEDHGKKFAWPIGIILGIILVVLLLKGINHLSGASWLNLPTLSWSPANTNSPVTDLKKDDRDAKIAALEKQLAATSGSSVLQTNTLITNSQPTVVVPTGAFTANWSNVTVSNGSGLQIIGNGNPVNIFLPNTNRNTSKVSQEAPKKSMKVVYPDGWQPSLSLTAPSSRFPADEVVNLKVQSGKVVEIVLLECRWNHDWTIDPSFESITLNTDGVRRTLFRPRPGYSQVVIETRVVLPSNKR